MKLCVLSASAVNFLLVAAKLPHVIGGEVFDFQPYQRGNSPVTERRKLPRNSFGLLSKQYYDTNIVS